MSRIVKSRAVVDDRQHKGEEMPPDLSLVEKTVLKNRILQGYGLVFNNPNGTINRDEAHDELNRILSHVEDAKSELRTIRRQIDEAHEEYEEFQKSRADANLLDDEVYRQRKLDIQLELAEGHREIEILRHQTEEEAKKIAEQAKGLGHHEGYAAGYQAAEEAFKQEAQPMLAQLAETIEEISDYGRVLYKEKEDEFVSLVTVVAEKVIQREIKTDSKIILDMLADILSRNHREVYVNLTLSPDMLPEKARSQQAVINKLTEKVPGLNVYIENEAGSGVVVVETPKGVTDMSIETQLNSIHESLMGEE